jgi:hypothetical protein
MSTVSAGAVLQARYASLKQKQCNDDASIRYTVGITTNNMSIELPIIVKPSMPSWEDLQSKLEHVINLPGLWITIRELYDQGYGAELETAAEIALATAKKSPFHLFATMTSKKAGKWATRTLAMVHETWQVRRNALMVVERLQLQVGSIKAVLALSWRLRGSIMRFLGLATEQGTGIRNPAGVFFALTKRQPRTS